VSRRDRRFRYGPYVDGPDPLAPPFDLRAAMDEIGRDVMEGSSPRTALQELLRRGMGERRGLDDLTREIWRRRSRLQRENRLDGTLEEVRPRVLEAIPAWIVRGVAESEVGPEVDDCSPTRREVGGDLRPRPVGECHEDRVDPAGVRTGAGRPGPPRPRERPSSGKSSRQFGIERQCGGRQVGMDRADRVIVALAAVQPDELDIRMARQEADQLTPDISGRADDPDPDASRSAVRVDAALIPRHEGRLVARRCLVSRRHSRMTIQLDCIVMQPLWRASRIRYSVADDLLQMR